ncbi:MAG: Translation initiation factor 2 beta subunit [Candidatus Methanohalarchaeum thermophilum]|uniref:Translation initiation factor 2 subunit beta n=1 Tax=Methanohalarchaeum thermophilum TaxID=1903181 RepID=A0A1Q6DXY0_METT1|nr:MAG: Translation initiation factor 2 beta subunit [Candidatus Methanohalarchaeum thermophilum]
MNSDYESLLDRGREEIKDLESIEKDRFEVPEADVFQEGDTTVLNNFLNIAKTFNRKPEHLLKFLSDKLGTSGKRKKDKASFKGSFSKKQVNQRIKEYAKNFVFCFECDSPDTRFIKVDDVKMLKCDACGARKSLSSITN